MDRFLEIKEKVVPLVLPYGVKRVAVFGSFVRVSSLRKAILIFLSRLNQEGSAVCALPHVLVSLLVCIDK